MPSLTQTPVPSLTIITHHFYEMYLFILEGRRNGLGSYSELSCSSSHRASTNRASERACSTARGSSQRPGASSRYSQCAQCNAAGPGHPAAPARLPACIHSRTQPGGINSTMSPLDGVAPKLSQSHAAKALDSLFPPCGEGETALTPTTHRSLRRGIIGDKRDAALICFRPFAEALTVATAVCRLLGGSRSLCPPSSAHSRLPHRDQPAHLPLLHPSRLSSSNKTKWCANFLCLVRR